jgi:hypothetical protein
MTSDDETKKMIRDVAGSGINAQKLELTLKQIRELPTAIKKEAA